MGCQFSLFLWLTPQSQNFPLRKLTTTSLHTCTAPRGIDGRGEQDRQRKDRYRFRLSVHKAAAHQH